MAALLDNPLNGQALTVRYGGVPEEHGIMASTVQARLRDGSPGSLRMTRAARAVSGSARDDLSG